MHRSGRRSGRRTPALDAEDRVTFSGACGPDLVADDAIPGGGRDPRSRIGSMEEFAAACLPCQADLLGVATRICRDRDAAGDLVQDTLIRAMCAWDSFRPDGSHGKGGSPMAWLIRILTNAFISDYRRKKRHQRMLEEWPEDAMAALHDVRPGERDRGGDPCDEVKAAIGRLGPGYQDIVRRADLRGEKYRDIADALQLPIGTVMSRLFRARRALEGELSEVAARDYGIRRGSSRRKARSTSQEAQP
jgi:RNA polymerase sigma-70 factor (ECF subfamily)